MTNKGNSYLREVLAAAGGPEWRILIPPFPGSNPGAPARFPTSFHCLDRSIVALTILISKAISRFISDSVPAAFARRCA